MRRPLFEENFDTRQAPQHERGEEASDEVTVRENIGNISSVLNPNQIDTDLDHLVPGKDLEMPGTQLEREEVDGRITMDEVPEVRTEVDDTRRRQKKDGNQFKVAYDIRNKQMMRASVVRHARNA